MRSTLRLERSRTSAAVSLVLLAAAAALAGAGAAAAAEGPVPAGIPHLDHVYLVMMENHGYSQIIDNPNAPFVNELAKSANLATNYFAIGHPSLTNYLEVVGGSNFGVQDDNDPDWHNAACTPNLSSGTASTDNPPSPKVCPIASRAWHEGRNAITVMWDENDYSSAPNTNQVPLIVIKNYGAHGVASAQRYNHFSLLKPPAAAFGLPCLNHACNPDVAVMSDLFR
jgi:hypothetical protein